MGLQCDRCWCDIEELLCPECAADTGGSANTPTNKPSAEISTLIAELYSNKPADRMYSREEVISYLKRVETSHVG